MSAGNDTKIIGGLGSISLHDLIQLLGMNRSTTTLVLRRQDSEGRIYFREGNVVHAFTDALEGPDAFAELLKWQDAHFEVEEGVPTLPRITISESAVGLMLSSMTKLDEGARDTPAPGTPASRPRAPGTPPTSGRFTPQKRRLGRGRATGHRARAASPLIVPVVGLALLLAAVAGVTWWAFGAGAEVPAAAQGVSPSPAAPDPTPSAEQPEPPVAEAIAPETVPPGSLAEATPEPTPTPVPDGVLQAMAPPDAELRVDGQRIEAGAHRVSPGRHTIEVIRPEVLGIQRETVEIGAGQTLRREFTADEYGWLQVVVIPWAEVFVEGASIGQTPMPRIKAAVGRHTLVLRHPEVAERQETVVVRQGETTLLRVTLPGVSG